MEESFRPREIVLVRHAQSVWNAWGRDKKQGGIAPPEMQEVPDHKTQITKRGREQAEITGRALGNLSEFGEFKVIYHSPYIRTLQTAELIQAQLSYHVPLHRDLLLVEQQFGWLDAGVFPDKKEFIKMQETFKILKKRIGKFYAKPPNGESWYDVACRTHDFLGKVFRKQWHNSSILIVSHAVTIATFLYHLYGRDEEATVRVYQESELENCGVVRFKHNLNTPHHWDLVTWNKVYWQ